MKISINAGHGGNDPGAVGNGYKEADLARQITAEFTKQARARGVDVHDGTAPGGGLTDSIKLINASKSDMAISIHLNAGGGTGTEVYRWRTAMQATINQAAAMSAAIAGAYGWANRGQKSDVTPRLPLGMAFIRDTTMAAYLIEWCFIDSAADIKKLFDVGIAKGVTALLDCIVGVPKAGTTPPPVVTTPTAIEKTPYRVRKSWADTLSQIGAYNVLENAKAAADNNPGYKVYDADGKEVYAPSAATPPVSGSDPIMGAAQIASPDVLADFVRRNNSDFNREIAVQFLKQGELYGVRGDVAFCQAIHETGWFKYGGDVSKDQNNFGGIGATGGGAAGNTFPTVEAGAKAHIQHLFAYACKYPLPAGEIQVDPRYHLVTRGIAPKWTDLNGRWAVPGTTYGQSILAHFENLKAFAANRPDTKPEPVPEAKPEPPQVCSCPKPTETAEYIELLSENRTLLDKLALVEADLLKLLERVK